MSASAEARYLARRLSLAYLTAFAIVLVIFAIAVHLAFLLEQRGDQQGQLRDLIAEGKTGFAMRGGKPRVDIDDVPLADPRLEGLAWFDSAQRLIAREGLDPSRESRARSMTGTTPLGTITAAIVFPEDRGNLLHVDFGLAAGLMIALGAATFGGRRLASQAIARVVATMRTLREFTADAAHELRGPLAALQSNADASLRDAGALTAAHRTRLETIASTARSMSRTVDDLLVIARASTPLERSLFVVNLAERAAAAATARRAQANGRGVDLRVERSEHARIYGDPHEIDRIIGNLIDNAVRFTPAGGSVIVDVWPDRGGACVRVRDTGVGIAPEDQPKIFERFWRGDPVRGHDAGSGLGLAIVSALVRRHGGDVSVRSAPGEGSEFVIWFPDRPPREGLRDISLQS